MDSRKPFDVNKMRELKGDIVKTFISFAGKGYNKKENPAKIISSQVVLCAWHSKSCDNLVKEIRFADNTGSRVTIA